MKEFEKEYSGSEEYFWSLSIHRLTNFQPNHLQTLYETW